MPVPLYRNTNISMDLFNDCVTSALDAALPLKTQTSPRTLEQWVGWQFLSESGVNYFRLLVLFKLYRWCSRVRGHPPLPNCNHRDHTINTARPEHAQLYKTQIVQYCRSPGFGMYTRWDTKVFPWISSPGSSLSRLQQLLLYNTTSIDQTHWIFFPAYWLVTHYFLIYKPWKSPGFIGHTGRNTCRLDQQKQ